MDSLPKTLQNKISRLLPNKDFEECILSIIDFYSKTEIFSLKEINLIHPIRAKIDLIFTNQLALLKGLTYNNEYEIQKFTLALLLPFNLNYYLILIGESFVCFLIDIEKLKIEGVDQKNKNQKNKLSLLLKSVFNNFEEYSTKFITAYVGSKDGCLYLLDSGIFFGYKKPLLYFKKEEIQSIETTTITSRTFNILISTSDNTVEFGMIDIKEYQNISEWICQSKITKTKEKYTNFIDLTEEALNLPNNEHVDINSEETDEDYDMSVSDSV